LSQHIVLLENKTTGVDACQSNFLLAFVWLFSTSQHIVLFNKSTPASHQYFFSQKMHQPLATNQ
jgi:hypothetical protein